MKVKKGDELLVRCSRKGEYLAAAMEDFDTDEDELFPVKLNQDTPLEGMANVWERGDSVPCRRGHATVMPLKKPKPKSKGKKTP